MYSACVSSWIRELVRQATPKSHGQQAIERDDGRPRLRIGPSRCFYYLVGLLMVDQASQPASARISVSMGRSFDVQ
ncbi:hypothetical protein VTO58DRAFT_103994 [Aureobasidium pullulans]